MLGVRVSFAGLLLLASSPAMAQDLSYQPINPSFGGSAFNSAHLLGLAGAQNKYRDPSDVDETTAEVFARQLESRLLSGLASQVVDAIFGENPQQSGTISFGSQSIRFDRGIDSVTLTITDTATGAVTTIVVPTLVKPR